MSDTLRLFFALPVPWPEAQEILHWRQQLPCSGTWVHERDLHLTLAFLGQQSPERLTELQAMAKQLEEHTAFELRLDHLGLWSDSLLHLAPSQPPMQLIRLQKALVEHLDRFGLALEQRAYRPHLTLARHATWPTRAAAFSVAWRADRFALFSSNSAKIGPRYQQIGT